MIQKKKEQAQSDMFHSVQEKQANLRKQKEMEQMENDMMKQYQAQQEIR